MHRICIEGSLVTSSPLQDISKSSVGYSRQLHSLIDKD